MTPLLIVVAAGCVLALAVHFGRQLWSRSRAVERHRHALDALAGITQHSEPDEPGANPGRQAHVRLVGPGAPAGTDGPLVLPPPRALAGMGPGRPSPLRRPSRLGPSAAAMEAGATASSLLRDPTTRLVRTAPPPPVRRPPGQPTGPSELPALPGEDEGATRPLPMVQPQVYYFDDFSPLAEEPLPSRRRGRGLERRARRQGRGERPGRPERRERAEQPDHPRPAAPGPTQPVAVAPPGPGGGEAAGPSPTGRKAKVARALAAAAVAAGLAAIGLAVAGSWGHGRQPLHPLHPVAVAPAPSTTPAPRHATTTVSTTLPPPKPAVFLSASQGTVTYQLRSPTASIVVKASGRCWVEVRVGSPQGSIVTEETLIAGQSAKVTGPAWVRLGNPPAVSVLVDGTALSVPGATAAVPMNLRFTLG